MLRPKPTARRPASLAGIALAGERVADNMAARARVASLPQRTDTHAGGFIPGRCPFEPVYQVAGDDVTQSRLV
jgi:hypothetical protein